MSAGNVAAGIQSASQVRRAFRADGAVVRRVVRFWSFAIGPRRRLVLVRDGIKINRHFALDSELNMILSEKRCPLFRIML